jgi:hypothetical protein
MGQMLKLFSVIAFMLMAPACTPVYESDYEIIPPRSHQGRMCANQCFMHKNQCQSNCSTQYSNCQMMSTVSNQLSYIAALNASKNSKTTPYYHSSNSCSTTACDNRCQADYHICHKNCGGQVIEHRVCTRYCN